MKGSTYLEISLRESKKLAGKIGNFVENILSHKKTKSSWYPLLTASHRGCRTIMGLMVWSLVYLHNIISLVS